MSDTLQTFCVSKPILLTSTSILWRTWSPARTQTIEEPITFWNSNILTKWEQTVVKLLYKVLSWCLCDLDGRDERAGPHRQHCPPDTRHDRPERTDPPTGTGELWPGSDAWPIPDIAWTLQNGIFGAPRVNMSKIRNTQTNQISRHNFINWGFSSCWIMRNQDAVGSSAVASQGSAGFELCRCARDDADENVSLLKAAWSVLFKVLLVEVRCLPSVWSWQSTM